MRAAAPCLLLLLFGCASTPPRPVADGVRHVEVNGADLSYTVEGAGPPLIIIHGWLSDYRSFERVAAAVAPHRTVVRVSLRLHYPNRWPVPDDHAPETYRVETHAADVAALIENLGLRRTDVMGHSYGGIVAVLLGRSRPDLVRRLILAEPSLFWIVRDLPAGAETIAGFEEERATIQAQLAARKPPLEVVRSTFGPANFDRFLERRRQILTDNAATLGPSQSQAWWALPFTCADAKALAMPVLLVEGGRSGAIARDFHEALQRCLPDARRVVIPGSGHLFQFDAPEATGEAILKFLLAE